MVFRNRYNVLLLACALFFTLSGCRRDVELSGLNDGYAVIVEASLPQIGDQVDSNVGSKVGSKVGTDTRAAGEVAFEKGSQVGMYVISRTVANVAGTLKHIDTPLETDEDVYNSNYYANAAGSLVRVPLEFYPKFEVETRKVDIYGYHPYDDAISSTTVMTAYPFEVLANQSTAADFLNSDFMWAKNIRGSESAGVVPAAVAVPMVFAHKMSRVDVWLTLPLISSTGKALDASVLPNNVRFFSVQRGAVMNLSTGAVATGSEVTKKGDMIPNVVAAGLPGGAVYKYSFVAPAQTFTAGDSFFSCEITYADASKGHIIYRANASMFGATHKLTTQTGKYHRLNLTLLDPIELTLTGSTIAPWTPGAVVAANLNSKVTTKFSATLNELTVAAGGINRVKVSTDVEGEFDLSTGVTFNSGVCSFEFGGGRSPRDYGFRITKLEFYNGETLVATSTYYISDRVYDPVSMDLGPVFLSPPAPDVEGVLIDDVYWATGNLVANGANGCKIGAPTDGGLYFQWGKLVGWSGGASGDGTGIASTSPALSAKVKPLGYTGRTNWVNEYTNIGSYTTINVATGWGDPCKHYLGGTWRTPTTQELCTLVGKTGSAWVPWGTSGLKGKWNDDPKGGWFGTGLGSNTGNIDATKQIFFPVSGNRSTSTGSFYRVGTYGYCWSSSVYTADSGYYLLLNEPLGVIPQNLNYRSDGFPVRCVSS